jgi:hypothetical protein
MRTSSGWRLTRWGRPIVRADREEWSIGCGASGLRVQSLLMVSFLPLSPGNVTYECLSTPGRRRFPWVPLPTLRTMDRFRRQVLLKGSGIRISTFRRSSSHWLLLWQFGRGSKKVYDAADVGVARFHGLMNQEGYEQIYQEAIPEFQNHGSREETLGFLRKVHTTLGNEHRCDMTGFFVNRTLNGTFAVPTIPRRLIGEQRKNSSAGG